MNETTCPSPLTDRPGMPDGARVPADAALGIGAPLSGRPREEVPFRPGRLLAAVTMPARPESVPALRRLAWTVARNRRLPEQAEEALGVIVTELAANAVLHSGGADVALLLEIDDTALTVRVRDNGQWRERPAPRCEPADLHAAFGRGLTLVDAYAVDTTLERTANGTVMRAVVAL
ncbi:ATP-binding protein [Streptomyces sp. NPDC047028]|uniref:ATP-binding protein n=1 Tax=Streptomyces sp. NPDC047028 TaxID=3155793 RepID=UPI0033F0CE40